MPTLIKNGTLITASETFQADILIENEQITLIGKDLSHPSAAIVDAAGKFITPGGVDPHTHFDLPMFGTVSSDDHYTGLFGTSPYLSDPLVLNIDIAWVTVIIYASRIE